MDLFTYAASLTQSEETRLQELETTIKQGLNTFVDVGLALMEIRDSGLYRREFGTFEDYCRERWGMERRHAYRLMDAAGVVGNVSHGTQTLPDSERQARPLTGLEPEQQREAWQRAVETAPEGRMTAAHVQSVVNEIKGGDNPVSRPHVANNSGNNEWYTPPEYIQAARAVMGDIDLDPASSELANRTVMAPVYFTADDDGLRYSWDGRVWMNPPYSSELIGQFTEKLTQHYLSGEITQAIVLVNNATETGWFRVMMDACAAICFPKGRIRFIDMQGNPTGAPLQGQAILYFGSATESFAGEFSRFGKVLYA